MARPSASEIDFYLAQYALDEQREVVERIEITKNDIFEFYMFAIGDNSEGDVRLVVMWPKENAPPSDWT